MRRIAATLMLIAATPAGAEVTSASSNGFDVRETIAVAVPPDQAFAAFGRIGSWWSGDHSYSGNAANLSLAIEPGGCWCEQLADGGGAQHMRVAYVEPGKRIMPTGSLGPLLSLATTGVMDVQFEAAGDGTRIVLDYRVAGFYAGGADKIAPGVDQVLGEQIARLKAYADKAR
jgi:uncharacterized protein YndB with AHSA1/START domain